MVSERATPPEQRSPPRITPAVALPASSLAPPAAMSVHSHRLPSEKLLPRPARCVAPCGGQRARGGDTILVKLES